MTQVSIEIPERILELMDASFKNPEKLLDALREVDHDEIKTDDYRFETFLRALKDPKTFEARETRYWPEYLRDQIVTELDNQKLSEIDPADTYDFTMSLFDNYLSDGTFTYSKDESIRLIREFWSDFNEPENYMFYCERNQKPTIFEQPEDFFLRQVIIDSNKLIYNLLNNPEYTNKVDGYWTTEDLKEILEKASDFEVNNVLYD